MLVGRADRRGRHRQEAEGAPRHGGNNVPRDGHDTLGWGRRRRKCGIRRKRSGADTIAVTGRACDPDFTHELPRKLLPTSQRGPTPTARKALISGVLPWRVGSGVDLKRAHCTGLPSHRWSCRAVPRGRSRRVFRLSIRPRRRRPARGPSRARHPGGARRTERDARPATRCAGRPPHRHPQRHCGRGRRGRRSANAPCPRAIVAEIATKTDGVPLYIEELTKSMLESGLGGAAASASASVPSTAIPATLQDALMARLDRLAPVREIAQIGAALGRDFSMRC